MAVATNGTKRLLAIMIFCNITDDVYSYIYIAPCGNMILPYYNWMYIYLTDFGLALTPQTKAKDVRFQRTGNYFYSKPIL